MVELLVAIIFALLGLIPLVLVIWLLIYAARAATIQVNRCQHCGYDLRNLGDVRNCPECGHPFMVNANGDAISSPQGPPAGPGPA